MNRLLEQLNYFFAKKEICPEVLVPRTDVVPSICLTGALGLLVGYIWLSSIYTIINNIRESETPDFADVKEEPSNFSDNDSSSTVEEDV